MALIYRNGRNIIIGVKRDKGKEPTMTKAQYKAEFEAELADLESRIANYDISHDSINGFISKDARLMKMKKRAAALKNVLATDLA